MEEAVGRTDGKRHSIYIITIAYRQMYNKIGNEYEIHNLTEIGPHSFVSILSL